MSLQGSKEKEDDKKLKLGFIKLSHGSLKILIETHQIYIFKYISSTVHFQFNGLVEMPKKRIRYFISVYSNLRIFQFKDIKSDKIFLNFKNVQLSFKIFILE